MLVGTNVVSLTQRTGGRSPATAEHAEAHLRQANRWYRRLVQASPGEAAGGMHQMTVRRAGCRSHSSGDCFPK